MSSPIRLGSALSLAGMKDEIRALPLSLAHKVAHQVAPLLTRLAGESWDRHQNVYGDPRKTGKEWTWIRGERAEQTRDARGRITGNVSVEPGQWSVKDGVPLDLYETGKTRETLKFVVDGTIVRCRLGPRYAKYLIGKYKILPIGDRTAMPTAWRFALGELVRTMTTNPARLAA